MGLFTSFQIKSRDPETRRRAALSLGAPGKASALPQLHLLLEDPEWRVRAAAAEALGVVGTPDAAPFLVEALLGSESVQDRDGAAAVRAAAIAGLVRVGPPAVDSVTTVLRGRQARLREAALEALGRIGGTEAVAALVPALGDDRSNVRQAAAVALGRAGGEAAVASLRDALAHKDPATRKCAVEALGAIGTAAAVDGLRQALADRDRGVRDTAIGALASLPLAEAAGALVDAFVSGERDLRLATSAVLKTKDWAPADRRGRILHAVLHGAFDQAAAEGPEALEPLLLTLTDRDPASRSGAARALGRLADPRSAAPLCGLLGDGDPSVREAAAASLVSVGPPCAVPLSRLVDERSPATREAVATVLSGIGGAACVDHLVSRLRVGDAASHAGTPLRIVRERESLDGTREAADALATLVPRVLHTLPPATLDALAGVGDIMLVEEGEVPTASDTVTCEAVRAAAARALAK